MNVAQAQAALVSAVGSSAEVIAPPACIVFSNGSDLELAGGANVVWGFNVRCYVGWQNNAESTAALAALVQAKLVILYALAGWKVVSVSPDTTSELAGGSLLTADIAVSTVVLLT